MDQQIKDLEIKTGTLFRLHEALAIEMRSLQILHTTLVGTVAGLSIKVGILATLGAVSGGAAMQLIFFVLKKV